MTADQRVFDGTLSLKTVEQLRKQGLVIRRFCMERPSLIG